MSDLGEYWPLFRRPRLRETIWPALPYRYGALEPVLSGDSVKEHVGQFAAPYALRFNRAAESGLGGKSNLDFCWGGLVLHHMYFWGMRKHGAAPSPDGPLSGMVRMHGGREDLIEQMVAKSVELQGSGWLCLRFRSRDLRLDPVLLHNHDLAPLQDEWVPLVVVDLWEHAFVPDYRARRAVYARSVLERLIDWSVAERRMKGALLRDQRSLQIGW